MAESPHKLVFDWGNLCRCSRGEWQQSPEGAAVSYDGLGNQFLWHPSSGGLLRYALDVECLSTKPPEILRPRGMTDESFFAAWTSAEVLAKLSDLPILIWLQRNRLPDFATRTSFTITLSSGCVARCRCFAWPECDIIFSCGLIATAKGWSAPPARIPSSRPYARN